MTRETRGRLILYAAAVVVAGVLAWFGFVYKAEPDAGTLLNSAEILAKVGAFDDAIENAGRALRQQPDLQYAHVILGYCHGRKGDAAASVEHYRRAVELTPDTDANRPVLRLYLAEALMAAGRHGDAAAEAQAVLDGRPAEHQAWIILGKARHAAGDGDGAAQAFEAARQAAPSDPAASILLADLREEAGDLPGALARLDDAVAAAAVPECLLRRARVRLAAGDRDGAVSDVVASAGKNVRETARVLAAEPALAVLEDDPRVAAVLPVEPADGPSAEKSEKP